MIREFDSRDNGLTLNGFLQAQLYMCRSCGSDESILRNDLKFMGYTDDLILKRSKSFVLAVHSDNQFKLQCQPFDKAAFDEAIELPIKRLGKVKNYENGNVKTYTYKYGYTGVGIAVENCSEDKILTFSLDCSAAYNVVSLRGGLLSSDTILPGKFKVVQHMMMDKTLDWGWSFTATYSWT